MSSSKHPWKRLDRAKMTDAKVDELADWALECLNTSNGLRFTQSGDTIVLASKEEDGYTTVTVGIIVKEYSIDPDDHSDMVVEAQEPLGHQSGCKFNLVPRRVCNCILSK